MNRAAALTLMLALGACVAAGPQGAAIAPTGPLRVTNNGAAFGFDQGAAARKRAEVLCAAQGLALRPGIYDRFDGGAWVYPGGCA